MEQISQNERCANNVVLPRYPNSLVKISQKAKKARGDEPHPKKYSIRLYGFPVLGTHNICTNQ